MKRRLVDLVALASILPLIATGSVSARAAPQLTLMVSDAVVQTVTASSATIIWTTSAPATSEVDYGLTTGYGLTTTDGGYATSHSITLSSPMLTGGTMYHFMVKSADKSGNIAASSDGFFVTKGTDVTVQLTNSASGQPVVGARVSWNDETDTSDNNGYATLVSLPTGKTTLVAQIGGITASQVITVNANDGSSQMVDITVPLPVTTPLWASLATWVLVVLAAGMAGYFISRGKPYARRLLAKLHKPLPHAAPPELSNEGPGVAADAPAPPAAAPSGTAPEAAETSAEPAKGNAAPEIAGEPRRYNINLKDLRSRLR